MKPAELQRRMAQALEAVRAGKPMHEALSAVFYDRPYKGDDRTTNEAAPDDQEGSPEDRARRAIPWRPRR